MIGFRAADRGVSMTLTHAVTLGITAVIVAFVLVGAGGLLETETEHSAGESLETIGERLAAELTHADRMATSDGATTDGVTTDGVTTDGATTDGPTDEIRLTVEQPRTVTNSGYRVEILEGCQEHDEALSASEHCLKLTANSVGKSVYVSLGELSADVDTEGTVRGGIVEVVHDGDELGVRNP